MSHAYTVAVFPLRNEQSLSEMQPKQWPSPSHTRPFSQYAWGLALVVAQQPSIQELTIQRVPVLGQSVATLQVGEASQTLTAHPLLVQCCPLGQLPLAHTPPQPSSAPHARPAQLGTHPQEPLAMQVESGHPKQATPPFPHAAFVVPGSQVLPLQHPVHDVGSHTHAPLTQC